jgi:hypothetical protein
MCALSSGVRSSQNWAKRGNSSGHGIAVSIASPRAERPYWFNAPEVRK